MKNWPINSRTLFNEYLFKNYPVLVSIDKGRPKSRYGHSETLLPGLPTTLTWYKDQDGSVGATQALLMKTEPLWPGYFLKASFPNSIKLGSRFQYLDLEGAQAFKP